MIIDYLECLIDACPPFWGKLSLMSVKREREVFEKSEKLGNGGSDKQQELRNIYTKARSPIQQEENKKLIGLKRTYTVTGHLKLHR
ncbi:MAG: hypothetical protein P1V20_30450 [Verrucomicrobiales bacterium]|nr:hypothetical protein [Verrucomicrobiales bacterium]